MILKNFVMLVGLFFAALGVSLSLKAKLGTSPLGVCPAVFSDSLGVSIGTVMWIMLSACVVVQIIILRKDFQLLQLLQLVVGFIYGKLTDFTLSLLSGIPDNILWLQVALCVLGIVCLAFGIYLLLEADLLMLAPDAMLVAITKVSDLEYSCIKIIMDCTMVVIAVIGSITLYHTLTDIGTGTIAAALFVGMLVKWFKKMEPLKQIIEI